MVPVFPKIRTSTSARKKYGSAERKVAAGRTQSTQEPRRQAMSTPMAVPATKATAVATTRSPSVQGRYETIRLLTGAFSDQDWPRLP